MRNAAEQIRKRKRKFVKDLGGKVLWRLEKMMAGFSIVPTTPFLDQTQFEWISLLEANWHTIRGELDQILKYKEEIPSFQDISEDQISISKDDDWKTYFFYGFGYKAEDNCARCPVTTRLIEQIPGMLTAFFSILYPGKHIPEHRGVYKGILRYHLGLKVPDPAKNCCFRIGNSYTHWEEGKSILFDDTYPHEVWNDTPGVRVVLLIDILRPMRFPVNMINRFLVHLIKRTGYVQDARKNQEAWERKFQFRGREEGKSA